MKPSLSLSCSVSVVASSMQYAAHPQNRLPISCCASATRFACVLNVRAFACNHSHCAPSPACVLARRANYLVVCSYTPTIRKPHPQNQTETTRGGAVPATSHKPKPRLRSNLLQVCFCDDADDGGVEAAVSCGSTPTKFSTGFTHERRCVFAVGGTLKLQENARNDRSMARRVNGSARCLPVRLRVCV